MTESVATIAIVGAGQAGGELAFSLRQNGYLGRIVLIGDEGYPPYRRPPLSKAVLAGQADYPSTQLKPESAYEKAQIEFVGGRKVTGIDRGARVLMLDDGQTIAYDKLALTTGGRVRTLRVPGADAPNIRTLRGIDDVKAIRERFVPGARLVVVGGGYIGLEVAAAAIKAGLSVTVLEVAPRVLARVTAPEISAFYEKVHRDAGVDLRTGVSVSRFEGEPLASRVVLGDGTAIPTDLVVVGIGLIPNTGLAEAAGLEVANGIVVDEFARTSDPDIVSAGDCTDHQSGFLGRRIRLESVQNATDQARVAAATLCGKLVPYAAVPWFWSDQYDLKLQMVGINQGYDRIVLRGEPDSRSFAAFYLKDGVLIAADTVSRPQEFMAAKQLVARRAALDPDRLRDDSIPLKALLESVPA